MALAAGTSSPPESQQPRPPVPRPLTSPPRPIGSTTTSLPPDDPVLPAPKPASSGSPEELVAAPPTSDEPEPSPLDEVMVQNWTLQRYAWLCAELAHAPDHVEEVWLVYGVRDANTRRNVMGSWNAQLASEPTLRRRHSELISHYRRMLGDKL